MFLGKLKEENKELFLQLSMHAAMSNSELAKEEEIVINEYFEELGIRNYSV